MSCEAEKDNETKIEYPWGRGLPAVFYPFRNDPGYKSPIVAVKLTPPRKSNCISLFSLFELLAANLLSRVV